MLNSTSRKSWIAVSVIGMAVTLAACRSERCEALVTNESPSVGLAQRYFVRLMDTVNLAPESAFKSGGAWQVTIVDARPDPQHKDGDIDGSLWVDFRVRSPSSQIISERCNSRFDVCVAHVVEKLPKKCRSPN